MLGLSNWRWVCAWEKQRRKHSISLALSPHPCLSVCGYGLLYAKSSPFVSEGVNVGNKVEQIGQLLLELIDPELAQLENAWKPSYRSG